MTISVIVLSYNQATYVQEAISSIQQQTGNIAFELIVVDDHSTDDSVKLLKELRSSLPFKLYVNSRNLGPSASRNKGIGNSTGDLIAFLDADDYWLPTRLQKTLNAYSSTPGAIIYSDAYYQYADLRTPERQSEVMPAHQGQILDHLFRRNFINLCSVLMPRELAKKIKFDEKIRSAEDYDFWIRLAATGCTFKYIDEPLVVYRKSPNNLTANRLHSIEYTWSVLEKNKPLAKTNEAKQNLKLHKINLLEEKLLVLRDTEQLRKAFEELKSLRPLGKREKAVYASLSINRQLGRMARKRLLR